LLLILYARYFFQRFRLLIGICLLAVSSHLSFYHDSGEDASDAGVFTVNHRIQNFGPVHNLKLLIKISLKTPEKIPQFLIRWHWLQVRRIECGLNFIER
jgi:hypothetical protein